MDVGSNIKNFRNLHDLSRKAFSELTGVSAGYIEEIENNKKTPTIETLLKISSAFNVTVSELIGETKDENEIPIELKSLIDNARELNSEQISNLNFFLKSLSPKIKHIKRNDIEFLVDLEIKPTGLTPEEEKKAENLINRLSDLIKEQKK